MDFLVGHVLVDVNPCGRCLIMASLPQKHLQFESQIISFINNDLRSIVRRMVLRDLAGLFSFDSGVVYAMGDEVVTRPYKIRDWLLNSSHNHFGLHQGQNVIVTMEFEVPKKHMIHYPLTWSHGFCGGRHKRKRRGPMTKKCCYNNILLIFGFLFREEEKMKLNRRQENGQT